MDVREHASTRPALEALAEIVWIVGFFGLIGVTITLTVAAREGWGAAADGLSAAGELLYGQLDWTIGTFLAVLAAIYIALIVGDVAGVPDAVARNRRILGLVAELVAAVLLVVGALVLVHCIRTPSEWAIWVVLGPSIALVLFFAANLGTFAVPALDVRIAEAEGTAQWARRRLGRLRSRSRRPAWLVLASNIVVVAALGTIALLVALAVVGIPPIEALTLGGVGLVLAEFVIIAALLLLTFGVCATVIGAARDWAFVAMAAIAALGVVSTLVWVAVLSLLQPASPGSESIAIGVFVATALSLATGAAPGRWLPRGVVDWTLSGAAARLAAAWVVRRYAAAVRELRRLRPRPSPPPTVRERLARWIIGSRGRAAGEPTRSAGRIGTGRSRLPS